MTRNYIGYFKTCLLALNLCLSKMYPRLLIVSVAESEYLTYAMNVPIVLYGDIHRRSSVIRIQQHTTKTRHQFSALT